MAEAAQSQLGSIASDKLQGSTAPLFPAPALSPAKVTRSSPDCELLIQHIMEAVCPGRSVIQERSQGPDIALGLRSLLSFGAIPGMDAPTLVPGLEVISAVGTRLGGGPPGAEVGSSVFLLWTPGLWGEPILMDGHFFPLSVDWLVDRCQKWPLSGDTDKRGWTELYSGKRGMGIFERMCTMDPMVRSRLWPCRRRFVSADSSPLTVKGELELNVIFPGLCCDMLFVVANIGSDGLLGTEALQSCLPHQLDI